MDRRGRGTSRKGAETQRKRKTELGREDEDVARGDAEKYEADGRTRADGELTPRRGDAKKKKDGVGVRG